MNRSLLLSLLIYALVILGFATLRGQLLALAIPFVLYLGASLLSVWRMNTVQKPKTNYNMT